MFATVWPIFPANSKIPLPRFLIDSPLASTFSIRLSKISTSKAIASPNAFVIFRTLYKSHALITLFMLVLNLVNFLARFVTILINLFGIRFLSCLATDLTTIYALLSAVVMDFTMNSSVFVITLLSSILPMMFVIA